VEADPTPVSSSPEIEVPTAPWSRTKEEVLQTLGVESARGLDRTQVTERRARWGANVLREHERRSAWSILGAQFRSLIVLLLAGAAALAFLTGQAVEGIAIVAVLVVNAAIGFVTELRAVVSMDALRHLGQVSTRVVRGGRQDEIPADELVPGDLVVFEGGDVVTADLRLLEASHLQVDEAALTGESAPVEKAPASLPSEPPLPDRKNMLHKGTAVTRGSGVGVVVGIGMDTELGRISRLVEETEDEATPLEETLAQLGRRLVAMTLALAAFLVASGLAVGRELLPMVEISIALAVAAIPEGLPIVATLALARGMWRMARRNALVERLAAVETLGSTGVILTDKTGTLTRNLMEVTRLELPGGSLETGKLDTESPGEPLEGKPADPLEPLGSGRGASLEERARALLLVMVLCNNASLDGSAGAGRNRGNRDPSDPGNEETPGKGPAAPEDEGEPRQNRGAGDPMEVGLLRAGAAVGLERSTVLERLPELREEAFDPSVAMMATFHGGEDAPWIAVKGAPEAVLQASTRAWDGEGTPDLDDEGRKRWLQRNEELADQGFRVLAAAARRASHVDDDPYRELTLLGLVALLDPPRGDVEEAIGACHEAGVRVVMVTGDQPGTARTVAAAVGLEADAEEVVLGADIPDLDRADAATKEKLRRVPVFARTTPEQKLDLIGLQQEAGEVVAMIGDGVNDAPALRKADIGVAMGRRGTQVAREAADIILQDDRFGTVVAAVEQGRAIFQNIRKFVSYLLSCNVSEILVVTGATVTGAPLPLLPLQILFLNLVTDVFPALALGFGEGAPGAMKRPPRPPSEPVLTRSHWTFIGGYGLLLTGSVLAGLYVALGPLGMEVGPAVSVSFLILGFGQIWHVFSMTERDSPLIVNEVTENGWVWGAVVLCVGLLLAAAYLPILSDVLRVTAPTLPVWGLVAGLSLAPLVAGRGVRSVARRLRRGDRPPRRPPPSPGSGHRRSGIPSPGPGRRSG